MSSGGEIRHGYAHLLESLRRRTEDHHLTQEEEVRFERSGRASLEHRGARERMTAAEREAARVAVRSALEEAYTDNS